MADPGYITGDTAVLLDGEAWVALFSTTLTSDTASITFTSTDDGQVGDFSQYMDLVAILYWRGNRAATHTQPHIDINGSSSGFEGQLFWGNGSGVVCEITEENRFGFLLIADTSTTNAFQASIVQFFDINSGKYKSFLAQNALNIGASGIVGMASVTWQSQAAITSITFKGSDDDLLDESRIDLFGVLPRMVTA